MYFSLSTNVIIDTVHALVAFEILTSSSSEETAHRLDSLLDPDRQAPLKLMIKNAFAETILQILPYVENANLNGETSSDNPGHEEATDSADIILGIDLRLPATYASSSASLIRRQLEQAVTMRVLSTLVTGISVADRNLTDEYSARWQSAIDTLISSLRTPLKPLIRKSF